MTRALDEQVARILGYEPINDYTYRVPPNEHNQCDIGPLPAFSLDYDGLPRMLAWREGGEVNFCAKCHNPLFGGYPCATCAAHEIEYAGEKPKGQCTICGKPFGIGGYCVHLDKLELKDDVILFTQAKLISGFREGGIYPEIAVISNAAVADLLARRAKT